MHTSSCARIFTCCQAGIQSHAAIGKIHPSSSSWAFPLYLVPKHTPGNCHPCDDFRALNKIIVTTTQSHIFTTSLPHSVKLPSSHIGIWYEPTTKFQLLLRRSENGYNHTLWFVPVSLNVIWSSECDTNFPEIYRPGVAWITILLWLCGLYSHCKFFTNGT